MKAIIFDSEINKDSIKALLSDIDKILESENIILYMNSCGGSYSDKDNLVNYINRQHERFEIVCNWEMSSSAFNLLLEVNCKIKLNNFSRIHLFTNNLDYRSLNDKYSIDNYLIEDLIESNKIQINMFRPFLSIGELLELEKGNDIVLNKDRVKLIVSKLNTKGIIL